MTILFVLLAILLLGFLIVVHELGHFMTARVQKIAVKEFSVGFGPKLWQRQGKKHETLYSLRAIPLGGYCAFFDEDADTLEKSDPRRFDAAAVWKRMIVVLAGSVMNIILAFVLAIVLHLAYGAVPAQPSVADVVPGSPAALAGVQAGDVLMSVGGWQLGEGEAAGLSEVVDKLEDGKAVSLEVMRDGKGHMINVVPEYDAQEGRRLIGISIIAYARPDIIQAVEGAWNSCVYASTAIVQSLGQLIFHGEGAGDVSGPVGVVQIIAEETRSGGLYMYLSLAILISINLGLINLLPVPGLDGSRFLFMVAEAIRRKPINKRVESTIHLIGFAVLFGLLILFTFRDIQRIFGG